MGWGGGWRGEGGLAGRVAVWLLVAAWRVIVVRCCVSAWRGERAAEEVRGGCRVWAGLFEGLLAWEGLLACQRWKWLLADEWGERFLCLWWEGEVRRLCYWAW